MRRFLLRSTGVITSLALGCSAAATKEGTSSDDAALVNTGTPVAGPGVGGAIPTLGLHGHLADAPISATDASSTHGAEFSNGQDLTSPPTQIRDPDFSTWVSRAQGWSSAIASTPNTATTAFASDMNAMISAAASKESTLDSGGLTAAFAVLGSAVPGLTVDTTPRVDDFEGYTPERVRWMEHQYAPSGSYFSGETNYTYADPAVFADARERGARLYCSARNAMNHQSPTVVTSMGEQSFATLTIFGHPIELMVVEPTAVIDGPLSATGGGANDGAQAFDVPLLLGTKITPIRGIGLPGLPEVRAPLSVVTGESEVSTPDEYRAIDGGVYFYPCGAGWCTGRYTFNDYSKSHRTMTHVDALVSGQQHVGATAPAITLFEVGPFSLDFTLGFSADIGTVAVQNDRALNAPSWGITSRPGADQHYGMWFNDGPYTLGALDATATTASLVSTATWSGPFATNNPFLVRALAADDRAITKATTVGLTGTLGADLGLFWGPLQVGLRGTGSLTAAGGQTHVVRDSIRGEDKDNATLLPVTALTITPRLTADVGFQAEVKLTIKLSTPFGDIGFDATILSTGPVSIAHFEGQEWPEQNRMRLGSGGTGNSMKSPIVSSHLPQQPLFGALGTDVDTCLASTAPNPPTPPPCPPTVDPGVVPRADICVMALPATGAFPSGVCGDVPGYVASLGLSAAQAQCVTDQLQFACKPDSFQGPDASGHGVVSHKLDLTDAASGTRLGNIVSECAGAFGTAWTSSHFEFGACGSDAHPITKQELFGLSGPGPIGGGTCH